MRITDDEGAEYHQAWRQPETISMPGYADDAVRGAPINATWLPKRGVFYAFTSDKFGHIANLVSSQVISV